MPQLQQTVNLPFLCLFVLLGPPNGLNAHPLIQVLIFSGDTLKDTREITFNQMSGHLLDQSSRQHKTNHHVTCDTF